jgi:hypothetical protein
VESGLGDAVTLGGVFFGHVSVQALSYVSPSLLLFDRILYGTTAQGGKGAGSAFDLTP